MSEKETLIMNGQALPFTPGHTLLEVAAAWSENEGTFTNSERRVNRVRTASAAPGMAKPNWWIFKQVAKRLGHEWPSESVQELWGNEISVLAPQL